MFASISDQNSASLSGKKERR